MKRLAIAICTACVLFACKGKKDEAKTDSASTETKMDSKTAENQPVLDSATKAKNWQDYMTPSDVHKMIASWDGTWEGDITFSMPGSPEMKSKSTEVNKMIMNGLYQESDHTGNMMGMPFQGKSLLAFDNHKKEFISTWIDNFGSGVMVMRGTWDDATKTITFKGTAVDPETKGEMNERETFKVVDDNTQEMEMFAPDPKTGQEVKVMHITYTRKK